MDTKFAKHYGNRLRLRVCGLAWQEGRLLVVNHRNLTGRDWWSPPGGGVEYGEDTHTSLRREFLEETGLHIEVGDLQFVCEYLKEPLHGVELFFQVTIQGGDLTVGKDPETESQIIAHVQFLSTAEIDALPAAERHGIFQLLPNAEKIKTARGYWRI
jgi:8-oxo-dGTP diphosphatase